MGMVKSSWARPLLIAKDTPAFIGNRIGIFSIQESVPYGKGNGNDR